MMVLLFLLFSPTLPCTADVGKEDVLRLLDSHTSEARIVEYVRKNAPATLLSTQDILDLRDAGATEPVLQALEAASRIPDGSTTLDLPQSDYVLENPEYYPYYYRYYPHYYPHFYTYPSFSYYFYWPHGYRRHSYPVRPFPYYGHPGWRYHPSYPYHSGSWGYHPWHDHQGFNGYHPRGGPRGGSVHQYRGGHSGTPR